MYALEINSTKSNIFKYYNCSKNLHHSFQKTEVIYSHNLKLIIRICLHIKNEKEIEGNQAQPILAGYMLEKH